MLDLMGSAYVIEHCVSEMRRGNTEKTYRAYVTDRLMEIVSALGGSGLRRWIDIITPAKEKPERGADEIISEITRGAGLRAVSKFGCNGADGDIGAG